MIEYIFVFIFFLLFFYLYMHYFRNASIKYLTKKEGYYIIDKTNYFKTFTEDDFKIKKCKNEDNCKKIYKNNLTEFTEAEKKHLKKLIEKTNKLIKPYSSLYNIHWTFCKITPNIEEGFPHTHENVIFLSNYFFNRKFKDKMETLIHEKIHLFQKRYPTKTEEFYKKMGFNKNNTNIKKRRTNPDLDEYNYDYKGTEFYYKYNNDPKGINDVTNFYSNNNREIINKYGFENEHPHEIFAYLISKKIISKNLKDENIIRYIS